MPQGDYSYVAYLNDQQILASLLRIEKNMDNFGKRGEQAFDKVGSKANAFGGLMQGVVAGGALAVTNALLNMAQQGVASFGQLLNSARESATQFDLMKRKFTAIFEGNEELAVATMNHISERAAGLGIDINEALSVSRAFLPDVRETEDPIKHLDDLLVGLRALAEEDPAQGIIGARYAIDEAMSGSLRSLRQRFEFTKAEIDILKQAQEELGDVAGTIEGINQVMRRRGVDMGALQGTYTQAVGQMAASTTKLKNALGKPIADVMTEQLMGLNEWLKENADDLEVFAQGVGRVVAEIIDFVGTNLMEWLENIDMADLEELANNLFDLVRSIEDIFEAGQGLGDLFGVMLTPVRELVELLLGIEFSGDFISDVNLVVERLNDAVETAAKLSGMTRAAAARQEARGKKIEELSAKKPFFSGFTEEELAEVDRAGEEAYAQSILKTVEALEASSKAKEENRRKSEELREEQEKDTSQIFEEGIDAWAGLTELTEEQIEAMEKEARALARVAFEREQAYQSALATEGPSQHTELLKKQAEAARQAADELQELYRIATAPAPSGRELLDEDQVKALDKAQEAIEKAQQSSQDRMIENEIRFGEKLIEQDIKNGQKRVKMWEDLLFDLETIGIKHNQKVADADLDADRDDEKMARKHTQERVDLAKDLAAKRAQIERDFIKTIQGIRNQFQLDAQDAEETQDALAYLAAIKRRDRAVQEAKQERVDTVQEAELQGQDRVEKLRVQQERERAEADIKNQEKLEDLQRSLDRDIEMRERNYEEQVRLQAIAEQEQFEQMQRAFQQQEEALGRSLERRLRDVRAELDAEVKAVLDAEAKKAEIAEQSRQRAVAAEAARYQGLAEYYQNNPQAGGRQHGGPVSKDVPYLTGERGRELFIPAVDGAILPNQQTERVLAALTRGSAAAYTTNSFTQNLSLLNPAQLTPEQMVITAEQSRRISLQTFHELFG